MGKSTNAPERVVNRDFAQRLAQVFAEEVGGGDPSPQAKDLSKDQADYQKQAQDDKAMSDKVASDKQAQDKVAQDLTHSVQIAGVSARPGYAHQGRRFASPITPELRPSLAPHALSAEADLTPDEVKKVVDDFKALLSETNEKLSQS